jgi:hypothetical protein
VLIVTGDKHLRPKMPYYRAVQKWMDWFLSSPYNVPENIYLSLGDETEESLNKGYVNRRLLRFYKDLKCERKIILQGNHDESLNHGSNLEILMEEEGIEIINEPTVMDIGNCHCLLLPNIPSTLYGQSVEEYYSTLRYDDTFDYCFAHVFDETRQFSKNQKICDLSNLDIKKRIFGHDHTYNLDSDGHYLGSISPNSYTEVNKEPYIYQIDVDTKEGVSTPCPLFLNYYNVEYPNPLPEIKEEFFLLRVIKSVDKQTSVDYYKKEAKKQGKELFIRRVERLRLIEKSEDEENQSSELTNKEYANIFYKKFNIDPEVENIMRKCV